MLVAGKCFKIKFRRDTNKITVPNFLLDKINTLLMTKGVFTRSDLHWKTNWKSFGFDESLPLEVSLVTETDSDARKFCILHLCKCTAAIRLPVRSEWKCLLATNNTATCQTSSYLSSVWMRLKPSVICIDFIHRNVTTVHHTPPQWALLLKWVHPCFASATEARDAGIIQEGYISTS